VKALVQRSLGLTRLLYAGYDRQFEGPGLIVLLGWERRDENKSDLNRAEEWIVERVFGLRVFPDAEGKMNLCLSDYMKVANANEAGILWVSQFTLSATLQSGFRPSFTDAMNPLLAQTRFSHLAEKVTQQSQAYPGVLNFMGQFGADMSLTFTNWGPVTIPLEL